MDKISKIIILVFSFSLFGVLGFGILTEAGSGDNVGFAWSENIGWVSFNSTNCDSDGDGLTDTGNYPECPVGQSISSYEVNLDTGSGKLSGYAWSENIGWVSFNESDLAGCPSGTCRAEINGQLGRSNVDIEGWARACAGTVNGDCTGASRTDGWDGWLKFDHGQANEPYIDIDGDWHGWAWGSDVVGWLSFNGADADAGGNYKVMVGQVNHPPTATNLEVVKGDYCSAPAHYFSWTYSDSDNDDESQFQFQVNDGPLSECDSDPSLCEINRCGDEQTPVAGVCPAPGTLSNPSPATSTQAVVVAVSPGSDQIGYNTTYYWRVKVWDSAGAESDWAEGSSFTTERHRYPSIDFSWSPSEPSQDEDVLFTDHSTVYGGADKAAWSWTFTNGNPASSNQQNPTIQFTADGPKEVTLQVTDSDNFSCQISKSVGVQAELPGWQEILPW